MAKPTQKKCKLKKTEEKKFRFFCAPLGMGFRRRRKTCDLLDFCRKWLGRFTYRAGLNEIRRGRDWSTGLVIATRLGRTRVAGRAWKTKSWRRVKENRC